MIRFLSLFLIHAFLLCALLCPAYCQPLYSLKELCRIANNNAEVIKIARDDLYIAQQDKERARSVLIPRATLFGRYTDHRNAVASFPDTTSYGGMLTQSFTLNGRELIAYDVSKKGIEQANFSKDSIRSDYIFQVAQAYIQTLSQMRLAEVAQADVDRLAAHRNSVEEKLNVGNVTKTALYRAQAELSRARTDQIVAANAVETNKAGLIRLTGVEEGFEISDQDVDKIQDFRTSLEEIETRALKNRYEIKAAQKSLEIASRTVTYERGDYWPTLSLEGGYNDNEFDFNTESGTPSSSDRENTYIMAELQFTLYDGGLRKAQVNQAIARQRQAKEALSNEEKIVEFQARESFLEFKTAKNALINLADEVTSAQENYNAVEMQFKYGMANSIDMMDANTLLVEAERRITNAQYAYYLAILKIIYTQGDILSHLLPPQP